MSFESLGLAPSILRAVEGEGYTTPTPIQAQAIPHLVEGRDLQGCAQTGTGKTAAFALPILHRLTAGGNPPKGSGRRIRVLVLSPTRELASQIFDSVNTYGKHTALRSAVIYGGVNQRPQVQKLQRGVDILIATPGRLFDLMNQGFVDLSSVEIFVLDEADRMFDMGFLPDIRRVVTELPVERQTVLFSATMPDSIAKLAAVILRDPVKINIAPPPRDEALIEETVCFVARAKKTALLADMIEKHSAARAIVFTRTKHGADRVATQLHRLGIKADAIHGNKSQNARQRALAAFKTNRTTVLVATDVASRGIDVDDVTHVFNYDLPHEPETYVHRIGRTGRAGATGVAISLCDPHDHDERKYLAGIERLRRNKLKIDDASSEAAPPTRHDGGSGQRSKPKPKDGRKHFGAFPAKRRRKPDEFASQSTFGQRRGKKHKGRKPSAPTT
jgi:ATP-dependent RNA helicase RhlE